MASSALATIRLLIQLAPIVAEAVDAVEALVPQGGKGAEKLAMVRSWIETAYGDAQLIAQLWPAIQTTIDRVVSVRNALGQFARSGGDQ